MGNAPVYGTTKEVEGITGYSYGGSGTTVDHCEVAFNVDDGFEFFGGTVNAKYISVLFVGDDGVEMDSKMDGTPRSFPQLYGATFVGHLEAVPASISSDDQVEAILRLREGTGGEFGNLVVTNVNSNAVGLYMNDCASEVRTQEKPAGGGPNYLWFSANNIVYGPGGSFLLEQGCEGVKTVTQANPALRIMPTDADEFSDVVDPRLSEASPAYQDVDAAPGDGFFDAVGYKGAFDGADLWLTGWSWLAENDVLYADQGGAGAGESDDAIVDSAGFAGIMAAVGLLGVGFLFALGMCIRYKRKYEQLIEPTVTKSALISDGDIDVEMPAEAELGTRAAEKPGQV